MEKNCEEKILQVKEFNLSTIQKSLSDTRKGIVDVVNELFYMSSDEWDMEQIELGLRKLGYAVEQYKIADAKSSVSNNIISFMEE